MEVESATQRVMGFAHSAGVTGMSQAVGGRELPRYRPGPRDWLQFAYLAVAFLLVVFIGLFAFALVFNEVTIFGWLFVGGFFAFRHGFIQYRNRLAVSGTATAKASAAAVGLAELAGRGHSEHTSLAPVSKMPCLFWSVKVDQWQRRSKRRGWNNKLRNEFGVETLEVECTFAAVTVPNHVNLRKRIAVLRDGRVVDMGW